jgi:phosphoserine aminotransferase
MAMWTMLGAKPVTTLAWESFGEGWVTDVAKQLKLDPTIIRADYGQVPDLDTIDWTNDVLFTWNGTTSGARVPNADFIPADREGLSFADATSAVFATTSTGRRSTSPPSRGRRFWAVKAAMAC